MVQLVLHECLLLSIIKKRVFLVRVVGLLFSVDSVQVNNVGQLWLHQQECYGLLLIIILYAVLFYNLLSMYHHGEGLI